MANLLIPIGVKAKVIGAATKAPTLTGDPFNQDAALEKGIHVHWALPDALTRAKTMGGGTDKQAVIFPGVPDLWLVTRFNQPPAAGAAPARGWSAWVVDSRAQTATALAKWVAPAAPDATKVFTMPGVLPSAKGMFTDTQHPSGYPGWGVWQGGQTDFDAALTSAVYYPSARTRFGFYDDLSGLPAGGNVSYTVVGWYSTPSNDPLTNADNRGRQIWEWLLSYNPHWTLRNLGALISTTATDSNIANWAPAIVTANAQTSVSGATRAKAALDMASTRIASMQKMQAALGASAALNPGLVYFDPNPTAILCHGSVMDVPLTPPAAAAPAIATNSIAVYPSMQRALATVTASKADPQSVDYTEMLLNDLDHKKDTMSGIIDMPGAVQALTFQGVPGAGTYYAQIRIGVAPQLFSVIKDVAISTALESTTTTGHWPIEVLQNPIQLVPAGPPKPKQSDYDAFRKQARDAFAAAAAAAKAAGKKLDPNRVRVTDTRPSAQSLKLAPSINGSGSDGAGWWIDINSTDGQDSNTDALAQILNSTFQQARVTVEMPTATDLFYQPGPRWYRPWSPQVVIQNGGRSYRFGEDGQYDPIHGTLECRRSQYIVRGMYAADGTLVQGKLLMANPAGITSVAGLPSDTLPLLQEALLLDQGSAPAMASAFAANVRQNAQDYFTATAQSIYVRRLVNLSAQQLEQLGTIKLEGDMPSPIVTTPWSDPWDPLFLDTNYSYAYSKIDTDWQLEEDHVEMTAKTAAATNPPAAQTEVFNDRSKVTATIAKVLGSALVTRRAIDPRGNEVLRQAAPAGLTATTFQTMDILSAPLVHTQTQNAPGSPYVPFDVALVARGYRQRCGNLTLNKLSLVDVFGATRTWTGGGAGSPSTPLTPRLPFFGRLQFRLQSAADPTAEADSKHSSICGILLPDFVDHSLEVFDSLGNGIGQISSDRGRLGGGPAVTLNVTFQPYPWVLQAKGLTGASNPLDAIDINAANPLRQFVAGVTAQSITMPASADPSTWFETGLTGMMRAIDTVRATLDPTYNTPDRKVSLMGEPILVMVAQVTLQSNSANDPAQVATGAALAQPPAIPPIPVRIGDVTRPDDGVLGIFEYNGDPASSRFAPVSKDCAQKAIFNGLTAGLPSNTGVAPVSHPFVKNQTNAITVNADQPVQLTLLTDVRGGIYATCGVLPRKRISVPKDFLDAALQNMEPVIEVGPILTVNATKNVQPLTPPPQVPGYDANFVYSSPGAPDPFPTAQLPPAPPIGDLPPSRVTLNEGWVRMDLHKGS